MWNDCLDALIVHSGILKEKRELLILRAKLTISIKHLWHCTDCIVHYRGVRYCDLTGRHCSSRVVSMHGPGHFVQYCIRDVFIVFNDRRGSRLGREAWSAIAHTAFRRRDSG